jgi:uncharacterized membrane protein
MKHLWQDRRYSACILGIIGLVFLGYTKGTDVGVPLSTICIGLGAANAYQKKGKE